MKKFYLLIFFAMAMIVGLARPAAAQGTSMTWTVDGLPREALVFAPQPTSSHAKHPLIFAFHGHGGNMQGASQQMRLQDLWPEAIVVYPQGLPTVTPIDPQGLRPGWQREPGENSDRDLKFFDAMLSTLKKSYAVDEARVYSSGFSNGAVFSYLLWAERAQSLTAFGITSGSLTPSVHLSSARAALIIAGETDQKIPIATQKEAIETVRKIDAATGHSQPCGSFCTLYSSTTQTPVEAIIHPAGHVFPPWAAEQIVGFFKSQKNLTASSSMQGASPKPSPVLNESAQTLNPTLLQPENVTYSSHGLSLKGYLYKPSGNGPFPAYVWNHGSEENPSNGQKLAKFWTEHGFVLFAPIRSGHGGNPGAYIGDEQQALKETGNRKQTFPETMKLHERANDDVVAALQWLKKQPFVDPKRIVVAGGSYGGIQTLLTAEQDAKQKLGVKCFVAMSPAAMSWGNGQLFGPWLTQVIKNSKAPIFLLQAQNDYSLGPSEVLGPVVTAKGFPSRNKIFPPHLDPTKNPKDPRQQGHGLFFGDPSAWQEDVLHYLKDCQVI